MPGLGADELNLALIDAVERSGGTAILVSGHQNPRQLLVVRGDETISLWVYLWTVTHGGGEQRPEHEYRIQITGVSSPLAENDQGATLLMGYEPGLKVFAGFDLCRHRNFSGQSPSIQINRQALVDAVDFGISIYRKSNDEIAVGIRPDYLLVYVQTFRDLHGAATDEQAMELMERAVKAEDIDAEASLQPDERQRVVQQVSRYARSANFRDKVLRAYDHRCAVSRWQLKLVEAAHIVPVAAGGNDDVTNGIALLPTYHTAFDRGLIYLDETYVMRINRSTAEDLRRFNLDGGLAEFQASLGHRIHLPPDRRQWPDPDLIRKAIGLRQIEA
ncbi:MAG: HNH endonuclease [Bacillota bacterium]|nr:HNH endonuclease [Bacillota bacterium]